MRSRAATTLLLIAAAALAGCADGGDPAGPGPTNTFVPPPSVGKGALVGVVVDDAVRPLAGVAIVATGPDGARQTGTTDAQGQFGFTDLVPGTWFVSATKLGYFPAQQSTDVVADVAAPKALRLLMAADAANRPFFESYVFDGFLECGVRTLAICFAVNQEYGDATGGNVTNDATQVRYPMQRPPAWVQSEMTWQSTQPAGGGLELMYSYGTCAEIYYCDHLVMGGSPLVLVANGTMAQTLWDEAPNEGELYIRVFPGEAAEGALAGATFQQEFRIVTHVFYGYEPPAGWTFGTAGPPPEPA